ncbi:MAG: FHA domain-containing protein [Planctomycetaceae bacterium]|jgi:adenylate cyclase|nr:FHA domain-containing protein [Planctomycetaceae bacterium]
MYGVLVPIGAGDPIMLEKREVVIGRKDGCDVVLRFDNVSGRHCRLVLSAGYWYVIDLNSSNGVKVNDVRTKDRRIDPGDVLSVAKHAFTIKYDPARNGATGEKPPLMFQEAEIMSQSLLEKVGLQKPKRAESGNGFRGGNEHNSFGSNDEFNVDGGQNDNDDNDDNDKDDGVETSDSTVIAEEKQVKKFYFDQLKFD